LRKRRNLDTVVFVVIQMIEALSHGAALRRPPGLSLARQRKRSCGQLWPTCMPGASRRFPFPKAARNSANQERPRGRIIVLQAATAKTKKCSPPAAAAIPDDAVRVQR
jgi:hypothetical protein